MLFLILFVLLLVLLYDHFRKKPDFSNLEPLQDTHLRLEIAQQIESAAKSETDEKIKQGMLRATAIVNSGAVAIAANLEGSEQAATNQKVSLSNGLQSTRTVADTATASVSSSTVSTATKPPQSNAITLLYVGAFLFVSAMIIFIAAPVLSGGVKTLLVFLTATLFYGTGLWLHQSSKLFRSAGQTFVAIGMVTLPLVGVAAYNLVFNEQHAYAIWFMTSIVSCGAYVYALFKLRTPLMGYLSVLSALSLVESAVLTTGLPLYFISWTLALVAIGLAILGKYKHLWPEQKEPLEFSAHLLLPSAVVVAAFNIQTFGWWQFSAALVLAAAFYAYCAQEKDQSIDNQSTFYAITTLFVLATVPSVATAIGSSMQASLIALLTATAVLATNLALFTRFGQHYLFRQTISVFGIVPFIVIWFLLGQDVILIALSLSIIILGSVAYSLKSAAWLSASFVPLLAMPLAVSSLKTNGLSASSLSIIYVAMGVVALGARYLTRDKDKDTNLAISSLYVISLSMGWFFAVNHSLQYSAVILTINMCLLAIASFIEREAKIFGAAFAGLFVAIALALSNTGSKIGLYISLSYAILALSSYAVAEVFNTSERSKIIQQIAPFGVYAASLSAFFTNSADSNVPAILLIVAALTLWYQSKKTSEIELETTAYISVAGAISWLLINADVRELLMYTHLWAATFGLMYYWRKKSNDNQNANNFLMLALLAFSVPFGLQTLGNSGTARGWLFVIEHILLILLGMSMKNDTVIKWGLVATIGAVIFQLRDLTFLLLGILGLTVIGIAIWLLNREGKKPGNSKQ